MKSNKKMIFALGLIVGACLMLIFTFAMPGRRTYVGRDIGIEEKVPHEISSPKDYEEEIPDREVFGGKLAKKQLPKKEEIEAFRQEEPVEVFEEQGSIEISPSGIATEAKRDMSEQERSGEESSIGIAMIAEQKEESHREPEKIMANEDIVKYYEQNKEYFKK